MMTRALRSAVRAVPGARRAVTTARFGNTGRVAPLSTWGTGRGTPVDRWYIERYLSAHADRVHGRVLEVKSDQYASSLGADVVDVVDIDGSNPEVSIAGDLCLATTLEPERYDAAIITQTLQFVPAPVAAVKNLTSSLRPGGALLLTVPCLSRVIDVTDRWRWTPPGLHDLLSDSVPPGTHVEVSGLGNGLVARAFLFGLAAEDLTPAALAVEDPDLPLIVGACVIRGY